MIMIMIMIISTFESNSSTSPFWHHVMFKIFCTCFDLWIETTSFKNLLRASTLRSKHRILRFFSRHQNWIALNVFHGRQALATALKCNKTVVDINLANTGCWDEGAEERWTWVQGV